MQRRPRCAPPQRGTGGPGPALSLTPGGVGLQRRSPAPAALSPRVFPPNFAPTRSPVGLFPGCRGRPDCHQEALPVSRCPSATKAARAVFLLAPALTGLLILSG